MKQETIAVPVELVREIRAVMARPVAQLRRDDGQCGSMLELAGTIPGDLRVLLQALPDPPKPDVVKECEAVLNRTLAGSMGTSYSGMRAALRRYRELLGMDRDPELE
jgi:hypothetical protein